MEYGESKLGFRDFRLKAEGLRNTNYPKGPSEVLGFRIVVM